MKNLKEQMTIIKDGISQLSEVMLDEFSLVRKELQASQEVMLLEIQTNCKLIEKGSERISDLDLKIQRSKQLQESYGSDFRESMERVSEDMRRVWQELKQKANCKPVENL